METLIDQIIKYLASDEFNAIEKFIWIIGLGAPFFYIFIQIRKNVKNKSFLDFGLNNKLYLSDRGYVPLRYTLEMPKRDDHNEFLFQTGKSDRSVEQLLLRKKKLSAHQWRPNQKNILLMGQVGTGKSKTLVSIYKKSYHPIRWPQNFKDQPHCILISMSKWDSPTSWKTDSSLQSFQSISDQASRKCLLLLDGFDEFISLNQIQNPAVLLNEIYSYFKNFKAVVVSSRLTNKLFESIQNQELNEDIKPVYLLPLSEKEIIKSIKSKYNFGKGFLSIPTRKTRRIIRKLKENNGLLLNKVGKRPLLLNFVDDIVQTQYKLRLHDLQTILGAASFKPSSNICKKEFFTKKAFLKELKYEINDQSDGTLRWKLQNAKEALIDKAQKTNQLTSFADIYHKITKAHHSRELNKQKLSQREKIQFLSVIDEFVGSIAYLLQKEGDYAIEKEELGKAWRQFLKSKKIEDLSERIDIKERSFFKALTRNELGFIHKSFQEFYQAKYLALDGTEELLQSAYFDLEESDPIYQQVNDLARSYLHFDKKDEGDVKKKYQEIAQVQFGKESYLVHKFTFQDKIDEEQILKKQFVLPKQKDFVTAVQFYFWFANLRDQYMESLDTFAGIDIRHFISESFNYRVLHKSEENDSWTIFKNRDFLDFNSILFCSFERWLGATAILLLEAYDDFVVLWKADSKGRLPIHYASERFVHPRRIGGKDRTYLVKANELLPFILKQSDDTPQMLNARDQEDRTPLDFSHSYEGLRIMLDYIPPGQKSMFYFSKNEGSNLLHQILLYVGFSVYEKIDLIKMFAERDNQLLASLNKEGRNPLGEYYRSSLIQEAFLKDHKKIIGTYLRAYEGPTSDIVNQEIGVHPTSLVEDWTCGSDFHTSTFFPILLSNYKGNINDIFYAESSYGSILVYALFMKGEKKVIELLKHWKGAKEEILFYQKEGTQNPSLVQKAIQDHSFQFVQQLFNFFDNKSDILFNHKDDAGWNLLHNAIYSRYHKYAHFNPKTKQVGEVVGYDKKPKQFRKEHLATVKMLLGLGFTFEEKSDAGKEVLSYVNEYEDEEMKAILIG